MLVRSRQATCAQISKRIRVRAGIERDERFADLHRIALSEMGASGATSAEILTTRGHSFSSQKILDTYVVPDKAAAIRAAQKRWK